MPNKILNIALAQINSSVGNLTANVAKMIDCIDRAVAAKADLIIFPELSLCGYAPQDLLLCKNFLYQCDLHLKKIIEYTQHIGVIIGHPIVEKSQLYNGSSFIYQQQIVTTHYKNELPNYAVFDEKRYFAQAKDTQIIEFKGYRLGLLICEDLWHAIPYQRCVEQGADLIIGINASPFHVDKHAHRLEKMQQHCKIHHVPLIYVNMIGGQDELIFDGGSFALNTQAKIIHQSPFFKEDLSIVKFEITDQQIQLHGNKNQDIPHATESIHQALVLGIKDYCQKNGFSDVLIGLSGGIDSAIVLALAVDALGATHVHAVMMPSQYTRAISIEDASYLAKNLQVQLDHIDIDPIYQTFLQQLKTIINLDEWSTTQENLQARCRGSLLMALSNRLNKLVLLTGNKSELAVGYSTLYGDMAGGFAVLKDVLKTQVYDLARFYNRYKEVIPARIIERPPSAELANNQIDQDSLPPYELLDAIIEDFVVKQHSIEELIQTGHDPNTVIQIIRRIQLNEYKRQQCAPGIRISARGFGKDWRFPISNGFRFTN